MIPQAARQGLAAACTLVLTAAGLQVGAAPAAAAEPAEIAVFPPAPSRAYAPDRVALAGATGFVHQYDAGSPVLWTRYADGATTVLDDPRIRSWPSAGGDAVWTAGVVEGHSVDGSVTVLDLGTMTWRTLRRPATGTVTAVYGDTMLIRPAAGEGLLNVRRFAADGSFVTVPVTGIPDGATAVAPQKGDPAGVVLRMTGPDTVRYGLLDPATGVVAPVADEVTGDQSVLLSADRVAFRGCPSGDTCTVRIWSRADLRAAPRTVTVPSAVTPDRILLVGAHLVAALPATGATRPPTVDHSAPGTPTVVPMTQPDGRSFAQAGNGGLVVGGAPGDWGVRRLTATGDGPITASVVLDLGGRMTTAGLTLSQGVLRHIQARRLPGDDRVRYPLSTYRPGTADAPADGGDLHDPVPCQDGVTCVRSVDANVYGTSYLGRNSTGDVLLWQRDRAGTSEVSTAVGAGSTLVDASPQFAIVDVAGDRQRIVKPGFRDWGESGPAGAAGLWFDSLWTQPAPGALRSRDLQTGSVANLTTTGMSCPADEIQVSARLTYLSCGPDGPAAVLHRPTARTVPLPPGRYLLGDNFVVRHDTTTGRLLRHAVTDGVLGEPAVVATLPRTPLTDTRNITWAVDKYSGNIAYADAGHAVHIVDPGVPPSPVVVTGRYTDREPTIDFGPSGALSIGWSLSRRVDAWSLTTTRLSTGDVVATTTGTTPAHGIRAGWDGHLTSGAKAPSGRYRWQLTGTADGVTTPLDSGVVTVLCGTPLFRSYNCPGTSSLLGVFRSGEAHWLTMVNGALTDGGATESWPLGTGTSSLTSAIVPFGDLDRDGANDLLVRSGTGTLTLHRGIHQPHFGGRETRTIGTGWGGFRQILSSGDLTGDGLPDVLAQDAAGGLRRYQGTSAGGLANGVAVPGSWAHPKLVGPGDVNGDGRADLYGVTAAGELQVFLGTGSGTFGAARKVGTGWSAYTLIGAGDLDEDGRNDLAARDAAGTLWRYPGDGAGGFGARAQLATGLQKYAGLF